MECTYAIGSCRFMLPNGDGQAIECDKCLFYTHGIRATGAMPILAKIINFIKTKTC
jgi:hypothetical protein